MASVSWPIKWPSSFDPTSYDPNLVELAEIFASGVLRQLTLGRVGGIPVTVMPSRTQCVVRRPHINGVPVRLDSDHWLCPCTTKRDFVQLVLPVGRVDEVMINGEVLDPSKYRMEDLCYLVRTDGLPFPACSNDDFTVTYLNGYPVDLSGQYVAGVLAFEYLRNITGEKGCRLRSGFSTITRQGVTMEMATGLFPEGLTGLHEVDTFVNQWNPNGLKVIPRIYSPDLHTNRQVTWKAP